jgi:hypothetical protein
VKKTDDPSKFLCPHCGEPGPWATPEQASAYGRLGAALSALATGAPTDTAALPALQAASGLPPELLAAKRTQAFQAYVRQAVGDDILTPEEETHVQDLVRVLGIDLGAFLAANPDLGRHVMIAEANGGSLPEVPSPRLIPKKGEIVHLEIPAVLLKDVAIRESQGGFSGFSIPIGRTGIRYRFGGYRGHSVVVGTERVAADQGTLVVSSQRAVFLGDKRTIEMPYAKLVDLRQFTDGVQFHVSNRQTAPVFQVGAPDVVAAFVHAAAQRLNSSA